MVTLKSRKLVVAYLLLALISGQYFLVLHNSEHLDDNSHNDNSNVCEVCSTARILGQDVLEHSQLLFSITKSTQNLLCYFEHTAQLSCNKPFQSHAPPTYFS